jgi:hypothetical protein
VRPTAAKFRGPLVRLPLLAELGRDQLLAEGLAGPDACGAIQGRACREDAAPQLTPAHRATRRLDAVPQRTRLALDGRAADRTGHADRPPILTISGSRPRLFGTDTLVPGEPAILTEGEFDTLLLWQEAGDLEAAGAGLKPRATRPRREAGSRPSA